MRHLAFFWACCVLPLAGLAQVVTAVPCDQMSLVVNVGSNPNSISIYHPGGYLTWPGESNVMAWEFSDGAGNVIHEEVLVDNNFVSFGFDIPLTDTLFVSVLLTNEDAMLDGEPVACLIEDFLVWEIDTWPFSGEEYGTWTLGGSVGFNANGPVTCIDEGLIDPNVFCPQVYAPVCGCDGVTYSNSCVATHSGGVTSWEEGVCATDAGCMCPWACNFDDQATSEDGSCDFLSCAGCTYAWSSNYDPEALYDDGSCIEDLVEDPCQADLNEDGSVSTADLLQFLTAFGEECN